MRGAQARRRPCNAPAIPGGSVCRVHGGSAPQVRDNARRVLLLERYAAAVLAWQANPGVPGQLTLRQLELLGRAAAAQRDLETYEEYMKAIRLLRVQLGLQNPMRHHGTT